MGIYYGGIAYQNAQINATANSIMSEARQILSAARLWSSNHNQSDISGMGTAGATGTGISALIAGKELSSWPSFGGNIGVNTSMVNPGPQPTASGTTPTTVALGSYDYGCYSIDGYEGKFFRALLSYNNLNYVYYGFGYVTPPYVTCTTNNSFISSNTDVSQNNHPIVRIAKAINAALNQIPTNANTAAMPYVGLPYVPSGSPHVSETQVYDSSGIFAQYGIYTDTNGNLQTNYCYLDVTPGSGIISIYCVFGPS